LASLHLGHGIYNLKTPIKSVNIAPSTEASNNDRSTAKNEAVSSFSMAHEHIIDR